MPEPKVVVAIGSCPATCNVFDGSPTMAGPLERLVPVDVYVPGCPPRPDAIIEGIAQAVEILAGKHNGPVTETYPEPLEREARI
jgi:membrane-bound hydrogenase subunit mbhJ